jgi:hypothetical protein
MKWLEGWFGTMSGVLGIVFTVIVSLVAAMGVQSSSGGESCITTSDGQTTCSAMNGPGYSPPPPQPNYVALIIMGVIILLFLGVLVGTWLDLGNRRLVGRIILLVSVSLLMVAALFASGGAGFFGGSAFGSAYLFVLFALIAGILACLRRAEPRVAAALIPPQQAPVTE